MSATVFLIHAVGPLKSRNSYPRSFFIAVMVISAVTVILMFATAIGAYRAMRNRGVARKDEENHSRDSSVLSFKGKEWSSNDGRSTEHIQHANRGPVPEDIEPDPVHGPRQQRGQILHTPSLNQTPSPIDSLTGRSPSCASDISHLSISLRTVGIEGTARTPWSSGEANTGEPIFGAYQSPVHVSNPISLPGCSDIDVKGGGCVDIEPTLPLAKGIMSADWVVVNLHNGHA
ncbi:hypothetical protein VTK73DRAFT_9256 [Phialemonium thermophilum]|uniref:Uncharacterized protein n=1 Tax=Phialemonium thermophilum TaxID=223376 RepID=A0ABR3XM18_9PEZI